MGQKWAWSSFPDWHHPCASVCSSNIDSILKSRDITLPTKVRLVKAMVFPVVMYGCKSWTVKKAEHRRIGAFELWCWRRLLRVPWTARRSNQSILKEIIPGISLEGMMRKLNLQYFGHLMRRVDSLEKTLMLGGIGGQQEKGTTEDEMAVWHHWRDGRESQWTPGVGDGQGGLACCNSWGRRESDTTERVNWTEVNWYNLTLWDLIQLFPLYPFCHNLSSIGHHLCFLRESQQLSSYLLGLLYIYSFSKKKHKIILLNKN